MGEQPKGKKETEKLNRDDHGVNYSTSAEKTGEATPEEAKKKNIGNAARSAAAGAVGGMVGGGVAMAANAASTPPSSSFRSSGAGSFSTRSLR